MATERAEDSFLYLFSWIPAPIVPAPTRNANKVANKWAMYRIAAAARLSFYRCEDVCVHARAFSSFIGHLISGRLSTHKRCSRLLRLSLNVCAERVVSPSFHTSSRAKVHWLQRSLVRTTRKPVFTIKKYAFYYATCFARKNYIVNCCRRIRRRRQRQRLGLVEYGSHYPHLFSSNSQLHHSHILFISNILYYRTVWLRRKDDITWHPSFFGESLLNEPKTAHHLPKWFGECNEKNRNDMVKRIQNAENKRFFAVSFSSHQYRSLTSFFGVVGFFHRLCVLGIGEQRWTRRIYMFFQHSVYFSETNGVWIYQR